MDSGESRLVSHSSEEVMKRTERINHQVASAVFVIGVACSLFHLYTGGAGSLFAMFQRNIHWMFMVTLIFLLNPLRRDVGWGLRSLDLALIALSLVSGFYILFNYEEIVIRLGDPTQTDLIMGGMTVLLVLEATRRSVGLPMVLIAVFAILYAFFGFLLPGDFGHRGYSLTRVISHLYLTTEGIFGLPLGVSATFIILFIIFGAFLEKSKASQFFIDVAFSLTGRTVAGPAKTAVLSSGLMATISGSAAANVATTGSITIPLMIRTGYRPSVAAAIEALASSGGQITPPLMGAGAFIMSEITGIPYIKIMAAALFPALLFYFSLYQMVHYEAVKNGLMPIEDSQRQPMKRLLITRGYLFLPVILLVVVLMAGRSPSRACFLAIVFVVILSWVRQETRMGSKGLLEALAQGARGAVMIAAATATAGIVIGMITLTGLGLSFSSLIISLSHGHLFLALLFTMVASIILGMGVPTAAAYLIVAVLGAPALMRLGVPEMAAHLFVFYFAIISAITPPVALAAYAGAAIARCSPMSAANYATAYGLFKFLLPFIFVYNTGLVLIGGIGQIATALISSAILSFLMAIIAVGYYQKPLNIVERLCLIACVPLLVYPSYWAKAAGVAAFTLALLTLKKRGARAAA